MYIAKKYKETNIAEYVLYMWHIEELIRSMNLDIETIDRNVIDAFEVNDESKQEIRRWYEVLISEMRSQGIIEQGHFSELNEYLMELTYLHQSLLTVYQDKEYQVLVKQAQPNIEELKKKAMKQSRFEIETAMNGLFGVLVLKLNKRQISESTQDAIKTISKMMAHLAKQYHRMKEGTLSLPKVMGN